MKDADCIERVARMFGVAARVRDRRRGPNQAVTYHIRLTGRRAVQLMVMLRPFLSARRQRQIDRALDVSVSRGLVPETVEPFLFEPVCEKILCDARPVEGQRQCIRHAEAA